MRSIVKTAKTVDEAVNDALVELNCSLDDVTIEILEEPKSGFLGLIGGRNAVVRVSSKVNEFEELLKEEKQINANLSNDLNTEDTKIEEPPVQETEVYESRVEETEVEDIEVENTRVVDTPTAPGRGDREADQRRPEETIEQPVAPVRREQDGEVADHQEVVEGVVVGTIDDQLQEDQTTLDDEAVADVDVIGEGLMDETDTDEDATEEVAELDNEDEMVAFAEDWLNDILAKMHIDGRAVGKVSNGENIHLEIVDISDVDTGIIIGRRAETIDALQYVVSIILNRKTANHYRVFLDVGGYRERRRASIEKMAKRNAEKVRKYKKPITLEAMNAYERRIVHTALQGMDHIVTVSEGRDPHRKVVIRYGN